MPDPTTTEPSIFAQAARRYGLSKKQISTLMSYFRAQTPFAEVKAAMQLEMDVINRIYALRWQDALPTISRELVSRSTQGGGRAPASLAAPAMSCTPSRELINMARQLLALRIDRLTIREYLRVDMATWRNILKSIEEGSQTPSDMAARQKKMNAV